jgi:tetratricopeptide (TPR) repeat protein
MLILAGFWTARARQSRAVQKNLHAIQLLNEGHVEEAGEVFERLAQSEMRSWGHAVFVFNRGVAHMLAGRLQRAFSLFNAVYYSRAFRWGSHRGYEPLLLIEMGTCAALLGWMKEAEDYRKKALDCLPQSEFPRMLILDALILVRSGRHQEAISVISRDWDAAEHVIRPPSLRSVRVLMGFAMEATGMANSQDFRLLMEASKPERFNPHASFNEYDYLGVQWPQMLDFLRRRGFTTR